jgi:hypothetical protein
MSSTTAIPETKQVVAQVGVAEVPVIAVRCPCGEAYQTLITNPQEFKAFTAGKPMKLTCQCGTVLEISAPMIQPAGSKILLA